MITCKLKGGLGNQMFQVASTIGIATKNNLDWGFEKPYSEFKNLHPTLDTGCTQTLKVPWGYHDISVKDNVALDGYMQSERYFSHCKYLIKHLFKIDGRKYLDKPYSVIHVRGGDYIGNQCHDVLTSKYWEHAISLLTRDSIIVVTDDVDYASKIFGNRYPITSNSVIQDLYTITQAESIAMSNSTFSWWGAWLSDAKRIIAPEQWFGESKKDWNTKDIYCNEWMVI